MISGGERYTQNINKTSYLCINIIVINTPLRICKTNAESLKMVEPSMELTGIADDDGGQNT